MDLLAPFRRQAAAPVAQAADNPAPATENASELALVRGADYPPLGSGNVAAAYVERLWQEGEQEALTRYKQATRNLLYENNRQYIDWLPAKRTWDDLPSIDDEIRVTMNYIRPILRARSARILSGAVELTAIPSSNSFEARDRAKAAVNLVNARWRAIQFHDKLRRALKLSFACGFAAIKSYWNPDIGAPTPATVLQAVPRQGPDGAPLYDERGQAVMEVAEIPVDRTGQPVEDPSQAYHYRPGDTDISIRSVFNIRLNPEAHGWTAGEGLRWLIDSEVVPLTVAREKFPQFATEIQANDGLETYVNYERIAQGSSTDRARANHPVPHAGQAQSQRVLNTVIREYWELPSRFFPDGRLIVACGKVTCYDGVWPCDVFPYTPIFDEIGTLTPYGRPCVNDMISPQDTINREWTAIVEEMSAAAKGQVAVLDTPGMPDQATMRKHSMIRIPMRSQLMGRSIRDIIQRMDPAMVPPDRWNMIQEAKATIFDIGGYHEVSRGQIPPGLDSGVAIERLQEAEYGQLEDAVQALKRSILSVAAQQLAIAKWGYGENEHRAIPVDRPDLRYMIETVTGDSLPYAEEIHFELENFKPQSQASLRAELKELMQIRPDIPTSHALKVMDLGRGVDGIFDSQTRDYARARGENIAFERGEFLAIPQGVALDPASGMLQQLPPMILHPDLSPFLLPDDDAHPIHIEVHHELLKDDTLPWEMRQIVQAHISEHRMLLNLQLQMAAAASAPSPTEEETGSNANENA